MEFLDDLIDNYFEVTQSIPAETTITSKSTSSGRKTPPTERAVVVTVSGKQSKRLLKAIPVDFGHSTDERVENISDSYKNSTNVIFRLNSTFEKRFGIML